MNKTILIGNLGQDPELRYTQGGTAVCNLSLATTRVWYNKKNDKQEETQWHRVTVWGKQAETIEKYQTKGSKLMIEGRIEYSSYEDKDGIKRYSTDIVCETFEFLGGGRRQDDRDRDYDDRRSRGRRDDHHDQRRRNDRDDHHDQRRRGDHRDHHDQRPRDDHGGGGHGGGNDSYIPEPADDDIPF